MYLIFWLVTKVTVSYNNNNIAQMVLSQSTLWLNGFEWNFFYLCVFAFNFIAHCEDDNTKKLLFYFHSLAFWRIRT